VSNFQSFVEENKPPIQYVLIKYVFQIKSKNYWTRPR